MPKEMPKNLMDFLQNPDRLSNTLVTYAEYLQSQTNNTSAMLHGNKVREFVEMARSSSFSNILRSHFDEIVTICEDLDLNFTIFGRRKSVYTFEQKVLQLLRKKVSLDLLRDIFAFRVIVFSRPETIEADTLNCYAAIEEIIAFFISQGFILCESKVTKTIRKPNSDILDKIYVPTGQLLSPSYRNAVKDYISKPKSNGYQSLHACFRDPITGYFFEVQIRTLAMDSWSEHGFANHSGYKKAEYSEAEVWDISKIKTDGFIYHDDGSYIDHIGLLEPKILIDTPVL